MGKFSKVTAGLVALLLVPGVIYWSLEDSGRESKDGQAQEVEVEHVLEGFQLIENVGEEGRWVLNSPKAEKEGGLVRLQSPRVVYSEAGDTKALITARGGQYNIADKAVKLRQEVELKYFEADQLLTTEVLRWNLSKGVVTTDRRVRLELREGVLTGKGLRANLDEERLQLDSEVEFQGY